MRTRIWRVLLLPALLLVPASSPAGPPAVVEVPRGERADWSEVRAQPGRLLVLSAEPASKWLLVDDEAADLKAFDGGKFAAFVAPAPGRHKLIVTAPDGTAARVVVVVGGEPGPGPVVPPKPADPLAARLKAAYDADPAEPAKRREQARSLALLYEAAAEMAADKAVATSGDLLKRVQAAAASKLVVGPDGLKGVRSAVGDELKALLPFDADLTDEQRKAVADLFGKVAATLKGF